MPRRRPALQDGQVLGRQHDKDDAAGDAAEPDQQQRAAPDRIAHQGKRPGQTGGHQHGERDHAHHAVDQHRIGGGAPIGLLADQPDAHGVAADARGQRLVEELRHHAVAEYLRLREVAAAAAENCSPAHAEQEVLRQGGQQSERDPARVDLAQAACHPAEIDPVERQIEQQPGNGELGEKGKRLAHCLVLNWRLGFPAAACRQMAGEFGLLRGWRIGSRRRRPYNGKRR